jgi:hypothetical protein
MSLTKDDLQAIQEIVHTTVKPMLDEAVDTLAQSTAAGFAEVHEKLAQHDAEFAIIHADLARIENTLHATVGQVDNHEVRLTKLETSVA